MGYKLTASGFVTRLSDGATLPAKWENGALVELDPDSQFVKELREWIAAGNTPEPADAPSAAEIVAAARRALDEQERAQAKLEAQILSDINMPPADVATVIDTLFPGFTVAQRVFLKRLVRLAQIGARGLLR